MGIQATSLPNDCAWGGSIGRVGDWVWVLFFCRRVSGLFTGRHGAANGIAFSSEQNACRLSSRFKLTCEFLLDATTY